MSTFAPFRRHAGIAAPLPVDNVDTDAIFPARFARRMDADFAAALFANWRFHDDGAERADFVLNQAPYRGASILVTGDNFGCGSSREHAVWALATWGVRAVIARGFGDIFRGNCFRNGLLAVDLDGAALERLLAAVESADGRETVVDLETRGIIAPDGAWLPFTVDPGHRHQLLNGLDEIGLTLDHATAIDAFQERHRAAQPWVWPRRD